MWAELVVDLGIESLRRSLVRASVFFGGSPRQWLFDNAKTVVLERIGDAIRFHPALLDLAARLHVQPALCAPRRPTDKGKVERAIRYLKERFFAARSFHSVAHGNAQLADFFATVAHERPHPRWPERRVMDVFEEERPRLLSLPEPLPETDVVTAASVDKAAFVRLDTNRYSVPAAYARRALTSSPTTRPCAFSTALTRWPVILARGLGTRPSSSANTAPRSSKPSARLATSRGATGSVSRSRRSRPSSPDGSMWGETSVP